MMSCRSAQLAGRDCLTWDKSDKIAPHIHVLYRDIPFILNIIATSKLGAPTLRGENN